MRSTFNTCWKSGCLQAFHGDGVTWHRARRTAEYSKRQMVNIRLSASSHGGSPTEGNRHQCAHCRGTGACSQTEASNRLRRLPARKLWDPWNTYRFAALPVTMVSRYGSTALNSYSRAVDVDPLRASGSSVIADVLELPRRCISKATNDRMAMIADRVARRLRDSGYASDNSGPFRAIHGRSATHQQVGELLLGRKPAAVSGQGRSPLCINASIRTEQVVSNPGL